MAYRDMTYDRKTAKVALYHHRVKGGRMGAPVSLQVALTDACFNRCIMCDHPSRTQHAMPLNDWLRKLEAFSGYGVESVCYSGGDPMAYAGFNDVMRAHVELRMAFGMTITGYAPPTIDMGLLRQAAWVRCSLDAVTPEVYAKVRGKIAVGKVLASMERMIAAGVNVAISGTLHADNESDWPNVLAWADAHGVTDIETHHIEPVSAPRAMRVPEKWERKIEPFQNCHAVFYQLYIDAQGDVYPCCITAGDTHDAPQAYKVGNLWADHWDRAIWPNVINYAKLSYQELPRVCRECCIQRLSQINHVCGRMPEGQQFF